MYIYVETDQSAREIADKLDSLGKFSTIVCTSDKEVFTDWVSDKPYEEKKRPSSNDWECMAGVEESV